LDRKILDLQFRLLRWVAPRDATTAVVVVGIDDASDRTLPEPAGLWHRHVGAFLTALKAGPPSVVGIDVVLPDRSFESILPGTDRLLMQGLIAARENYPLVLALTVDPAGAPREVYRPLLSAAGSENHGFALFPKDDDNTVRRFDERLRDGGETVPTLVGQMVRRLGHTPVNGTIDFSYGAPFQYVPFGRVLEWAAREDRDALVRTFEGKAVLLGSVQPFTDRVRTPIPLAAWEHEARDTPGVLLNAQALRALMDGAILQRIPDGVLAGLAALGTMLWLVSTGSRVFALVSGLVALLLFGASTWLIPRGWIVPITPLAVAAVGSLAARHAWDTVGLLHERRQLRASFAGYVSPTVMSEILAGRIAPVLGGAAGYVCVLFSDIRGFTTLSEGLPPEQVLAFLNRYYERVVPIVHRHDGVVTSFMGDGFMAVFGAAVPMVNPCQAAFDAARDIVDHVSEFNAELAAEGAKPLEIGVGLNAGVAVIGHVGSSVRHDYTAIGDVTNVASRVEGLTKEAGCPIVLTKAVADRLSGAHAPADSGNGASVPQLVALGPMAIKGHAPVQVFGYRPVLREGAMPHVLP